METIGRYQVVRQLGHGGMGRVYLARDPTLERDVALKVLHREATQAGLREEAKALAALNHPSIVTVYEIGEHAGQDFIAMEYLPGRSLRQLLADGNVKLRRGELLAICAKVAVAIAAAHQAGILHRDVKPENIIVGKGGDVKVVDFGIARRLERIASRPSRAVTAQELADVLTRAVTNDGGTDTIVSAGTETMFGTPAYMAPEVLLGEGSTEASDIYSLGVVLHECVAGHRPYTGSTLHEVLAQMIDAPPPALDDRLAPLIRRMLAREPQQRPALDEIIGALAPVRDSFGLPPRRTWVPVVVGAALVALAVVTWRVMTSDAPVPPPAPAAAALPLSATVAVAPIAIAMPSYGTEPARPEILADTFARLLGEVGGARIAGIAIPVDATDARANAKSLGAGYIASIKIAERDRELHATVQLDAVAAGTSGPAPRTFELTKPSPQLAGLLDDAAEQIARALAPTAQLDRAPNRVRAQVFYRQGHDVIETAHFTDARPYLEQAVDADPTFFEGWYSLALVLGWMEAPEELVAATTAKALGAAAPGPKQELMRGVAAFLRGDFSDARMRLEPLLAISGVTAPDPKELDYYLGEANWHDGRHAAAVDFFQRALVVDKQFRPAAIHVEQYALARRDERLARYVIGLQAEDSERIEFAIRHYKELADAAKFPWNLQAQLVLGRTPAPELELRMQGTGIDAAAYQVARALGAGDLEHARTLLATAWATEIAGKPLDPNQLYALEGLGEVILAAGMLDEARQLVAVLAHASQGKHPPARGYQRFSMLAAGLLGDPSLIVHDGVTERNARLGVAMQAEIDHDRAKAVAILDELVRDPSATWDYPERAALIRNLRALGKTKERAAVCTETLAPAMYRHAFLVLQRLCRS